MTDPRNDASLGDGSYIINKNARADTLLGDAAQWLRHARYLAEQVNDKVSQVDVTDTYHINHSLEAMRVFTQMSLQCVREVRLQLAWDEAMPPANAVHRHDVIRD